MKISFFIKNLLFPFLAFIAFVYLFVFTFVSFPLISSSLTFLLGLVLFLLFLRNKRLEFKRGWRVRHDGRDGIYYEEIDDHGAWRRLSIRSEIIPEGVSHHCIYFPSPSKWSEFPEWAQGRRSEIISRMKEVYSEPKYNYAEE